MYIRHVIAVVFYSSLVVIVIINTYIRPCCLFYNPTAPFFHIGMRHQQNGVNMCSLYMHPEHQQPIIRSLHTDGFICILYVYTFLIYMYTNYMDGYLCRVAHPFLMHESKSNQRP